MISRNLWSEALVKNECYLFKGNSNSLFPEQLTVNNKNNPDWIFLQESSAVYVREYGEFKPENNSDDPRLWFICIPCRWMDANALSNTSDESFYYGIYTSKSAKEHFESIRDHNGKLSRGLSLLDLTCLENCYRLAKL